MFHLFWYRLNCILGWPVLWLFDVLLACLGHGYKTQREISRKSLSNIWHGREWNDPAGGEGGE